MGWIYRLDAKGSSARILSITVWKIAPLLLDIRAVFRSFDFVGVRSCLLRAMKGQRNIGIVGAGVGGLAAASFLSAQGHTVTVYEQEPSPVFHGPGLLLTPMGLNVLKRLGLAVDVMNFGVPISRIEGRDVSRPQPGLNLAFDPKGEGHMAVGLDRAALILLLMEDAQARGVRFELGQRVLAALKTDKPYLRIEGGRQAGPFDLLIDAGGAHSALSPLIRRKHRFGTLWANVALPKGETDLGGIFRQRYRGANQMAAVLPVGQIPGDPLPRATVFWSLEQDKLAQWQDIDFATFKSEAAALWPDLGVLLEPLNSHADMSFTSSTSGALTRTAWRRTAHIGDAAQQSARFVSQGPAMALVDAMVLADCLSDREVNGASIKYMTRRKPHVWTYQAAAALLTPMFQSRYGFPAALRNRLVAPLTSSGAMEGIVAKFIGGRILPAAFGMGSRENSAPLTPTDAAVGEPGE